MKNMKLLLSVTFLAVVNMGAVGLANEAEVSFDPYNQGPTVSHEESSPSTKAPEYSSNFTTVVLNGVKMQNSSACGTRKNDGSIAICVSNDGGGYDVYDRTGKDVYYESQNSICSDQALSQQDVRRLYDERETCKKTSWGSCDEEINAFAKAYSNAWSNCYYANINVFETNRAWRNAIVEARPGCEVTVKLSVPKFNILKIDSKCAVLSAIDGSNDAG